MRTSEKFYHRSFKRLPPLFKLIHYPKRELLDKLQVRVVVFRDRIEIKAIFPIEPIYSQKCTSTYEGERDKG